MKSNTWKSAKTNPTEDGPYLVFAVECDDAMGDCPFQTVAYWDWKTGWIDEKSFGIVPSHWMPLPPPPND